MNGTSENSGNSCGTSGHCSHLTVTTGTSMPDLGRKKCHHIKKILKSCKISILGMPRYPVCYLTRSELGDIPSSKRIFFLMIRVTPIYLLFNIPRRGSFKDQTHFLNHRFFSPEKKSQGIPYIFSKNEYFSMIL